VLTQGGYFRNSLLQGSLPSIKHSQLVPRLKNRRNVDEELKFHQERAGRGGGVLEIVVLAVIAEGGYFKNYLLWTPLLVPFCIQLTITQKQIALL
jgi:hypothetical protein